MRSKFGKALIAVGLICLAGALGMTFYNILDEKRAEKAVTVETAALEALIPQKAPAEQPVVPEPQAVMPTVTYEDTGYVGIVEVPSLGLTLPVQSQWSEALLKNAPCLYAGTLYDGMVIAGHNYRSHFEPLLQASAGDEVLFTDVDGNVWHYTVETTEVISGRDVDAMMAGDWDLTLFTCTYGARDRYTLRCTRTR